MTGNIRKTNSGVRKHGKWSEIVEFAEKVEETLEDLVARETHEKFNFWRPRHEESEEELKRKTVKAATVNENTMELSSEGLTGDFKNASGDIRAAGKKAKKREPPSEELENASRNMIKPLISKITKSFRSFENLVYSKFALRANRYYLDTEDLSVDLRTRRDGLYQMDVNANTEESRKRLKAEFVND